VGEAHFSKKIKFAFMLKKRSMAEKQGIKELDPKTAGFELNLFFSERASPRSKDSGNSR